MRWLAALVLLAGCSHKAAVAPVDQTLNRLEHAGDIALAQELPVQAAEQYRAALVRARERDDAGAIADAGFNLATSQLAANEPAAALLTAQEIRIELARRGMTDPALDLITATALFRGNRSGEAERWATRLDGSGTLSNKAWFLRGLIAGERQNRAGLIQAEAALTPDADSADRAELRAHMAHNPALALTAADLRREALDYRGMARCLALAAVFTADPALAADLYLRAGRSAAAQHDVAQARAWLVHARVGILRVEADRAIGSLVLDQLRK